MSRRLTSTIQFMLILAMVVGMVGFSAQSAQAGACVLFPPFVAEYERFGVNVATDFGRDIDDYEVGRIRASWYLDYSFREKPKHPEGMAYLQLLKLANWMPVEVDHHLVSTKGRVPEAITYTYDWRKTLEPIVKANRGYAWIIGNEPDRVGQDGREAWIYAINYHDAYHFIKQIDPTATVIIAAMVQATPVRFRYLDLVLSEYQRMYGKRMPVDYWNIHGFILREEIGNWGASIPPAPAQERETIWAPEGMLYQIEEHGNIEIFKGQIIAFRQWMAARGYRDTPLMLSEYGILFPDLFRYADGRRYDYEFLREYMLASFDFLLTATDENIGYPADGNRLVQTWSWFSLNEIEYVSDPEDENYGRGFNGNLFDHDSRVMTPLGADFAAYTGPLYVAYTEVEALNATLTPPLIQGTGEPFTLRVDVSVVNRGNQPAQQVGVRFWLGHPSHGVLLGTSELENTLDVRCSEQHVVQFEWESDGLPPGIYEIWVELFYENDGNDQDPSNNLIRRTLVVGEGGSINGVWIPAVFR